MLSNLDNNLLKEFDKQNFKANIISLIMDKLDNDDKKNRFLSFMIENRNIILSLNDLFNELKIINS